MYTVHTTPSQLYHEELTSASSWNVSHYGPQEFGAHQLWDHYVRQVYEKSINQSIYIYIYINNLKKKTKQTNK